MYSIVTPNRNRLDTLVQVVPSWQAAPLVSEIVIVDFGSDRPIGLADFPDRRKLKLVQVGATEGGRIGLAINLGGAHPACEGVLKLHSHTELTRPDCPSALA